MSLGSKDPESQVYLFGLMDKLEQVRGDIDACPPCRGMWGDDITDQLAIPSTDQVRARDRRSIHRRYSCRRIHRKLWLEAVLASRQRRPERKGDTVSLQRWEAEVQRWRGELTLVRYPA
jgi:Zn-finger nucleic acid-binding protein